MKQFQRYERRFTGQVVQLSFWQTFTGWLRGGKWVTEKYVFTEVMPDDPAYEDAPYAEQFCTSEELHLFKQEGEP